MVKTHKRLSFDVDGIIADFYKAACKKYNMPEVPTPVFYVPWINEYHDALMDDDEFWLNLSTMILPNEIPFYIHCYITSIDAKQRANRETWLAKNGYQNRPVIISHSKEDICNSEEIDVHVDDKLDTIIAIQKNCPNTVPILHMPWYLQYPAEEIPPNTIVTRNVDELNAAINKILQNDMVI